jgi:adenylylsulfate kinase
MFEDALKGHINTSKYAILAKYPVNTVLCAILSLHLLLILNYMTNLNTIWHRSTVTRQRRNQQNRHKSVVLWFTGLSGSGKSTLAHAVEEQLHQQGCRTFVLDGDNVRHGLTSDLAFSEEDRKENIRRIGEVSKLFVEAGILVLTSFISPFAADRDKVRNLMPLGNFLEIYCKATLAKCEARDVKGMYKKARAGIIKNYTGIDSPYEKPNKPELIVDTDLETVEESIQKIITLLVSRKIFDT